MFFAVRLVDAERDRAHSVPVATSERLGWCSVWEVNGRDESPQELEALRRRWQRMLSVPKNEAGGVVFVEPEVFRSAECAVQLELTRVFSTGVQFQFRVVVRQQAARYRRWTEEPGQAPTAPSMLGMGDSGDDALWVGVKLADGRTATNAGGRPPGVELREGDVTLARIGGQIGGGSALLTYFLTPSPPPGPVTLILAWPAFDVEESTLVIPGDELAAAATRRVTLWPRQPEDERIKPIRSDRPPLGG